MTAAFDSDATGAPVALAREGHIIRLAFNFNPPLQERVKALPFAAYDGDSRTWTVGLCAQTVDALRQFHYQGLTQNSIDSLLAEGETPEPCKAAVLRQGSTRRPYIVVPSFRNDGLYQRLKLIETGIWKNGSMSYGPLAAARLAELVKEGILDDPDGLLNSAGNAAVTLTFDTRTGRFVTLGDERAQPVFDHFFPKADVVAAWRHKGLAVEFSDPMSEEIYRGELARVGPGLQPEGLTVKLFEYQAKTVAMAVERTGLGVFHAPGLGKTICAIATGVELFNRGEIPRVVVISPGAVKSQWSREVSRFTGTPLDEIVVVQGSKAQREAAYEAAKNARWLILNYDLLARDYEHIEPLVRDSLLVADEAHRLKGDRRVQRAEKGRQLATKAARRMALSGTPLISNLAEWHAVMGQWTVPGSLGTWFDYGARYMLRSKFGNTFEGARAHALPELKARSAPHYIRFTKEQVAKHLPPLRVKTVMLDPDAAYANALKRAHRDAREELAAAARARAAARGAGILDGQLFDAAEQGAEMTAVGQLRALCVSPRLLDMSDSAAAQTLLKSGLIPDEDGPKVDFLREMGRELRDAGDRAVVFTYSKKMVQLLAERFDEDGIRYVTFTGDSSADDRDAAVRAFTTPDSDDFRGPTFFIATDAAAEGLNLSACCSTLVQVEPSWVPSVSIQRSNRIHRIDSVNPSFLVINLVLSQTIEMGILKLLESKVDLADALFGESGGRRLATGRGGQNLFEAAMQQFREAD